MPFPWSRHKSGGWRAQYARVARWHNRVTKIGRAKSRANDNDMEAEHDFVYAFFQTCYHLRDWLQHSGAVERAKLDDFFRDNKEMQVCRDICIGTKHLRVDKPSVDSSFNIGREYVPAEWPGDRPHINERWFIIAGDTKYDIFELADRCMELWKQFLKQHRLYRAAKQ